MLTRRKKDVERPVSTQSGYSKLEAFWSSKSKGKDEDGLEQEALFQIEGLDEGGWVWICSPHDQPHEHDTWGRNLGPQEKVVEVLSQWPGSVDHS